MILTVRLFWIYLFLQILVFVLKWFSFHWENLIMLLSDSIVFPTACRKGYPFFLIILLLIRMVFVITWERKKNLSLNLVFLLLLLNFVSGSRLELMYVSLIVIIRSSLIYLHFFHWLCCCHSS